VKTNGTYQLLVYVDDVNILGTTTYTIKKNSENLIATGKEIGLEVKAEETKYVLLYHHHNARQNHKIKIAIKDPMKMWWSSNIQE
jgi:hypothetical protein